MGKKRPAFDQELYPEWMAGRTSWLPKQTPRNTKTHLAEEDPTPVQGREAYIRARERAREILDLICNPHKE